MAEQQQYDANSEAVRAHLSIMQGVINRMAGNSASCKNWCVVLVAAILVLVARTDTADYALLALLPTALFLFLDAYYLALEQVFRNSYNAFVRKLHSDDGIVLSDLYVVRPVRRGQPANVGQPALDVNLAVLPDAGHSDCAGLEV